ncbi:MAG TPA: VOC family protein [Streptosporangiaceae bacterium]|nr:VOC family protein [Streptosporangiaceae bacterium]
MTLNQITMVTDQDKARDFYVNALGFSVKLDYPMDSPPGSSKLALSCDDTDKTYADLTDGDNWLITQDPAGADG